MIDKEAMMRRCIELAKKGRGHVSPNPMVGCVIVKNEEIIGEGYHREFGGPHAEVNAIESSAQSVEGADVFVNLEPCSYFGKTPPCVDLLIEKKVRRVFVGISDPNPKVNGTGLKKLRQAGIEVEVGLLEGEARSLNESFTKYITTGLPFATLKIAQSLDGIIALKNHKSRYITSRDSLTKVHALRAEHDAVLVGAGTIAADNPSLTVRHVEGRSPVRIIIDGRLSSPLTAGIFHDHASRVIIFHALNPRSRTWRKLSQLEKLGIETFQLRGGKDGRISIKSVLKAIGALNLASVMIEGGAGVFSQFIEQKMADKLQLFVAPVILGDGLRFVRDLGLVSLSRAIRIKNASVSQVGVDHLVTGYF